jgi:hypothetical protein
LPTAGQQRIGDPGGEGSSSEKMKVVMIPRRMSSCIPGKWVMVNGRKG